MTTIRQKIEKADQVHVVDNAANPYIHALTGTVRVLMARAGLTTFNITQAEWEQAHDNDEDLSIHRHGNEMEIRLDKYAEIESAVIKVLGENDAGQETVS